ncbi:MAG: M13 family metallopeptidase [Gemmatimonadaceae bacterium]|nr:M13 family metallopeptidase [Chitinophagaceae bacterium]
MNVKCFFSVVVSAVCFAACKESGKDQQSGPDFLAATIDTTIRPENDFFGYANGAWVKNNPIPSDESAWGIGYLVDKEIYIRLRKINENAVAEKAAKGTISQKIGDFWYSGMDSVEIEKQGISPLKADLDKIAAIKNETDLVRMAAALERKGVGVLFSSSVTQDDKNSASMAFYLWQGGLGLPNRDYYFNTDERTTGIRKGYQEYLVKVFRRLGQDSLAASASAKGVYDLETRMAKSSRKLADLRDPYKNYNKMDLGRLQKLSPNLNWSLYLADIGVKNLDSVIVGQPEFYTGLNNEIKTSDIEVWRNYLRARLVTSSASFLDSSTFADLFEFRKLLSGVTQQRPRWKRVLMAEEETMGEALGQLFVKEYFSEQAKERYIQLVEAIRDAYRERIIKLTWMSDSTKQKALVKLAKMTRKVGYPDKWKDFSSLEIDRGPFVLNMQRAREWWHVYSINKLGKPVDRDEWEMSPQTYNAYYSPSNNEIVLPAGIFVIPGKRDEELDDAFVYGYAAASTIGHEITHGFDDQGRQYDEKGNLHNWWQPSDEQKFNERARAIIQQYNEFNPVDTLHVNGDATQGENIADLGGLLLGLDAFKKTESFKKGEKIGGLTPLQRYFLGYTYGWMYDTKKESLAQQVMTDVHSPARERVNGPMVNIPEFYEAFGIKSGSPMYRADSLRVNIW